MDELADRLSGVMRATADLAESAGGLVGHVKAVIDLGGRGGAALSLVRREVRVKPLPGAGERPPEAAKISLTAIVYGLSANHLQNFLTQRLDLAFPPLYPAFLK
jgi:hypothetical protein